MFKCPDILKYQFTDSFKLKLSDKCCYKLKKDLLHKWQNEDWENWFINEYKIKLCKLYYPPFNFKRSGCKGCPFNKNLKLELDNLKKVSPNEYKQCWLLWGKVYKEYERIGYRLK